MTDYGGPAFPCAGTPVMDAATGIGTRTDFQGMSLRDYFAAKAMEAMIGNEMDCETQTLARRAYLVADCMLKARKE